MRATAETAATKMGGNLKFMVRGIGGRFGISKKLATQGGRVLGQRTRSQASTRWSTNQTDATR